MTDFKVREEVLRLVTGGTLKENVDAFMNLARRYHDELDSLEVNNEESVVRAVFIGREAVAAGNIVLEQIQQKTLETGFPPLSKEEFIEMQTASRSIRPKTVSTLVRTTPGIFGEPGDLLLKYGKSETGLTIVHLCAAYIESARLSKGLVDQDLEDVPDGLYNHLFRVILAGLAMSEELRTDVKLEMKATGRNHEAQWEAIFAKVVSAAATKAMQDYELQFAPGGLQVDVLEGDELPVTFIRIPVVATEPVARANSKMNAMIAKVLANMPSIKIPTGVVFSFRRVE